MIYSSLAVLSPGGVFSWEVMAVRWGKNGTPSSLLVPGIEERRLVPGPQTLWPAQDSLLQLAWHALPWLAPVAMLSELEAHAQQGWFEDGRRTKRSWPRSWLGARQQTASGQQAKPGPQRGSVHRDGPPLRKAPAPVKCCSSLCAVPKLPYYLRVDPG